MESCSQDLPLLGSLLSWKIGRGDRIRIGEDSWMGSTRNCRLLEALNIVLVSKEIYCSIEATNPKTTSVWNQAWELEDQLGI